jgi:hypothetical protein
LLFEGLRGTFVVDASQLSTDRKKFISEQKAKFLKTLESFVGKKILRRRQAKNLMCAELK